MPTVTIPRDVTSQEIVSSLSERLEPRYRVQAGKRVNWGFGLPEDADSDNIVVSTGSGRFWRTQVSVQRRGGRTAVHIQPPGPVQLWIINTVGIAKRVHHALLDTPGLDAS